MNVRPCRRTSCSLLFVALSHSLISPFMSIAYKKHQFHTPFAYQFLSTIMYISACRSVVRKPDFAHTASCRPPDLTAASYSIILPASRVGPPRGSASSLVLAVVIFLVYHIALTTRTPLCRADYLRKRGRPDMVRTCDKGDYGSLLLLLRLIKYHQSRPRRRGPSRRLHRA